MSTKITIPIEHILNAVYIFSADAARVLPEGAQHTDIAATPDSEDTLRIYIAEAVINLSASTARFIRLSVDQQDIILSSPKRATSAQIPEMILTQNIINIIAASTTARWLLASAQPKLAGDYYALAKTATDTLRKLLHTRTTEGLIHAQDDFKRRSEDVKHYNTNTSQDSQQQQYHRRVEDETLISTAESKKCEQCKEPCCQCEASQDMKHYHARTIDTQPLCQADGHYHRKTQYSHPFYLPQ